MPLTLPIAREIGLFIDLEKVHILNNISFHEYVSVYSMLSVITHPNNWLLTFGHHLHGQYIRIEHWSDFLVGTGQAQPEMRDPLQQQAEETKGPSLSTSTSPETSSGPAPASDDQQRQKRKKA